MKKKYINPEMLVADIETSHMIAQSVKISTDPVNPGSAQSRQFDFMAFEQATEEEIEKTKNTLEEDFDDDLDENQYEHPINKQPLGIP